MTDTPSQIPCAGVDTRDWHAWTNAMPPGPATLIAIGEAYVPNPGVEAMLVPTAPQGINPKILMLDIHFVQRPGIWPQVMTWVPVRYEKSSAAGQYTDVSIMCEGNIIRNIKLQEAS